MNDAVIPMTGAKAWVYDPTRDTIDYTTSDGVLHSYSLQSQAITMALRIDGTPGSLALSPDGHYLLIGNTSPDLTSSPTAIQKTYADNITRVDLTTQTIDHLTFPLTDGYETGITHLAVAADGTALVTTNFAGSGWTTFRSFNAEAVHPVFSPVAGLNSVTQNTFLLPSENNQYILVEEANISDGPLHVFSSGSDSITATTDLYRLGSSGYQEGGGAISEAAGLVVNVTYNNVFVLDLSLKPVADLSSYQFTGKIINAAFSANGKDLLLWDGPGGKVDILDTTTWQQVGVLSLPDIVHTPPNNAGTYAMQVIHQGQTLALFEGSQADLIDLTGRMPGPGATLSGPGGDSLVGSNGDDTISGGSGGTNYLRGGYGTDSIVGGLAHNEINGNQGDDVIIGRSGVGDWLLGGQGSDLVDASRSTAANIVNGNLGNDTLIGGAAADTLRGGQGDDVIHAGSGNEWISGDLGNNTIYGGEGVDIFHAGAGHDFIHGWHNGDIVQVDHGVTVISISQVNADVHISFSNGGVMDLLNTQQALLPSNWMVSS